jgi:hypothetical protein
MDSSQNKKMNHNRNNVKIAIGARLSRASQG